MSNLENRETDASQLDEYKNRYERRVIGTQIWLESKEQERTSKSRQRTVMN